MSEQHIKEYERGYKDGYRDGMPDLGPLAEQGWVRLPVDADGVPIHMGDTVYRATAKPVFRFQVESMALTDDVWDVDGHEPGELRHWEASSIEDLLDEFAQKNEERYTDEEYASIRAEYADRIREMMDE